MGSVLLAALGYLYAKYRYKSQREFENPFANAIHERLNLSYSDFFNGPGKIYADAMTQMVGLLKAQSNVDLKALGKLRNQQIRTVIAITPIYLQT